MAATPAPPGDPGNQGAPPARSGLPPTGGPPRREGEAASRAREISGRRLARLNLLLVAAMVLLVAGPPLGRSYHAWRARAPAPATGSPALARGGPASLDLPPPSEMPLVPPTPVSKESSRPEAVAAREAQALYQAGRIAEACDRYVDVARRSSEAADRKNAAGCWARLGKDAYQAGHAAEAVLQYQRAVAVVPEDPVLWTALAIAHLKAGDIGLARAVLDKARRAFPNDAELTYLSAEVAERQGRTGDAVEALRRLVAAQPSHARARTLLAALEQEGRLEAGYWAQESAHFLVRYEGAQGIDLGRSVVDTLEDAYASIGRDLGTYPDGKVQVGIYAAPVFGDVIGAPPHLIVGAYDGKKLRLNLASSHAYSRDLGRLVRHEYTHLLIHLLSKGRAPIWLHEGLAQALEPRSAPRLIEVSVPRAALTLAGIERLSRTADPAALVAGYGLTHIAVEFLLDRGGMGAMRDLLGRIGAGMPVPQALREVYGFGPEEVEARLLAATGRG